MKNIDEDIRAQTQLQWNTTACGSVDDYEVGTLEYFDAVMANRYQIQDWQHNYFNFDTYTGRKVLEIGVGHGSDMMQFAKNGADIYGLDITQNHLDLTKKHFELRNMPVTLKNGDATSTPFQDNFFDVVYSFGVFHHFPEIELALNESKRILKVDGEIMLALYYKWSAFHIFSKILMNGLRNGWLFSKGYRGLMATLETGADGIKIKPYVTTYSKRALRKLFADFEIEDISVKQLKQEDFYPAFLGRWLKPFINKLDPYLGWYVVIKAKKIP